MKIKSSKPLLRMQFIRKRKEFGQPYKFSENDLEKTIDPKPIPADHVADRETKVLEIG